MDDAPRPEDVADALVRVDRLIAALGEDLMNIPDHKRNTRFHTSRVKERRRLLAQRDFLIKRQCELVELN